jgi:phenylpropionate dioxygenase-like ring-hydroxylating dioxygenase large terminal subunit
LLRLFRDVKIFRVLMEGLNLVVWRGVSGKSYVADAYCPHLGAHLGVGGEVAGECIKCPFHGWAFEGKDGKCVDIPYSDSSKHARH